MKRSSVKFRAPHDAEIVQDVHILLPVAAVMAADRLALAVQLGTEGLHLVNTVVGREVTSVLCFFQLRFTADTSMSKN